MKIKAPPPASAGLMLSYKFSAECRHCMYACSPQWEGDWISTDDIELDDHPPSDFKELRPKEFYAQLEGAGTV